MTVACGICGRQCIPMADYDAPTCIACDDAMALVVERANFRIPTNPEWLPDVTGCGTPAGYLAHYRREEVPCDPCVHFWEIAQDNIAAREFVRKRRETRDGVSRLRLPDRAEPSGTRPVVSALHGTRSRGELRADPRAGHGSSAPRQQAQVADRVMTSVPRQMDLFEQIREQIAEASA